MRNWLLFITFLFVQSIYSQWMPTGNIEGGFVKTISVNGQFIYIQTEQGLFVSKDAGKKWQNMNVSEGVNSDEIGFVKVLEGKVFVGTKKGLFVSKDNGVSWDLFNTGLPRNSIIMNVDLYKDGYVAYTTESLFFSEKFISNWEKRRGDLPGNIYIKDICIDAGVIYIATFGRGVYQSVDDGLIWKSVSDGLTVSMNKKIISIGKLGSLLIAGTNREGVWISNNKGSTWVEANEGIPAKTNVNDISIKANTIWLSTNQGVFYSNNNGGVWNKSNGNLSADINVECITVFGSDIYIGSKGAGVFKTSNNGSSWESINQGLKRSSPVKCLFTESERYYAGTENAGLYYSDNKGLTWSQLSSGMPSQININSIKKNNKTLFIATNSYIFCSDDEGESWIQMKEGLGSKNVLDIDVVDSVIFACTDKGVYMLKKNAKIWESRSEGILSKQINCIQTFKGKKDTIIIVGTENGIYKSVNHGLKWELMNPGYMNGMKVYDIYLRDNEIIVGTDKYGVIKSDNLGKNWYVQNNGLAYRCLPRCFVSYGKKMLALATSAGMYISKNGGKDWIEYNMGISNLDMHSVVIDGVNIFCGNQAGNVYFSPILK